MHRSVFRCFLYHCAELAQGRWLRPFSFTAALLILFSSPQGALTEPSKKPLPGTAPLTLEGDIALGLVNGVHRFVDAQGDDAISKRAEAFKRDTSTPRAFVSSIDRRRNRLAELLAVVDSREPFHGFELLTTTEHSSVLYECDQYVIHAVRWPVVRGIHGEGLLLEPKLKRPVKQAVIVLTGDIQSSRSGDLLNFVAAIASSGVRVLIPVLIDRGNDHSLTQMGRFQTGLTNREFCYRPAFELGRHLIGYELQKIISAAEGFVQEGERRHEEVSVGLIDLGGLGPLGLYAMALCPRISVGQINLGNSLVVPIAEQPIDQNVFGLTKEFGFSELVAARGPAKADCFRGARMGIWEGEPPTSVWRKRRALTDAVERISEHGRGGRPLES